MFCRYCGKELEENQTVCPACGRGEEESVTPEENVATEAPTEEMPVAEAALAPEKPKMSKGLKVTMTVVESLLLAMVLALVLYLGVGHTFADLKDGAADLLVNIGLIEKENNVYYKDSYTVSASQTEKKHDDIVAALGENSLNNGQLQVYYWMQVYDFLNEYSYYLSYFGLDYTKDLSAQTCTLTETEMSWEQYFLMEALHSWQRYQALYVAANAEGYQVPAEYQEEMDGLRESMEADATKNNYDSVEAMLQDEFGPGVTFDDYMYYLERYYVGNLYFSDVVDKLEVTDAELEAYFKENEETLKKSGITKDSGLLLDLRQILLKPESAKDDDGNSVITEEAWEDCLKKTQAIYDQFLAGDKTEDSFSALAKENSQDTSTASSGGLLQYVPKLGLTAVDVRHILIMPVDVDEFDSSATYTDEQWEACRKEAQALLDQFLAGEQTEEAFGALANEFSDDNNGKVTDGGIYEDVTQGQMVDAFDEWIFDTTRVAGDTGLVKTPYGYHVMYFVHRDDAMETWAFGEEHKAGDTTLIRTDSGYRVMYYVSGEEGWIVYSRNGVLSNKSMELLESYVENSEMGVTYKNIAMGAPDLSK